MQLSNANLITENTRKSFPDGIAPHGTDALRFTFCALASTSRDIQFSLKRIEGYRNFCNKIWNAARYVLMQIEQRPHILEEKTVDFTLAEKWILDQLQSTIENAIHALSEYRFDHFSQILYEFVWNEYCDWYLELSKVILNDPQMSIAHTAGTCQTLMHVLDQLLRLLHPIMPFITETIWQSLSRKNAESTIMLQTYPTPNKNQLNKTACAQIEELKSILLTIRNLRGEINVAPNITLELWIYPRTEENQQLIKPIEAWLLKIGKIQRIKWLENTTTLPFSATTVYKNLKFYIPLENLIDKKMEKQRLEKEINRLIQELKRSENKLSNVDYTKKAPPEVVLKEQEKAKLFRTNLETLQCQLEKMNIQ